MLLSICEKYGVRVQSLQHVLEGYKVAAEIAAHGASASTFSDWWAYKIEAYDAIPYNAALLTEAGARVCIKSDSEELIRHLNLEAAKMVKYGAVSEAQALEFITLNPASELGTRSPDGDAGSGQGRRYRPVQRPPVQHFRPMRDQPDRRRSLLPAQGSRRQVRSREATRPACPVPTWPPDTSRVEIPATSPKGIYALTNANDSPGQRTRHQASGPSW